MDKTYEQGFKDGVNAISKKKQKAKKPLKKKKVPKKAVKKKAAKNNLLDL